MDNRGIRHDFPFINIRKGTTAQTKENVSVLYCIAFNDYKPFNIFLCVHASMNLHDSGRGNVTFCTISSRRLGAGINKNHRAVHQQHMIFLFNTRISVHQNMSIIAIRVCVGVLWILLLFSILPLCANIDRGPS